MVGTNTAQNDDPQLTARLWQGRQPLRIVLDKQLRLSNSLKLFDASAPTWVINEKKNETEGNVHYKQLSFDDLLLKSILKELHAASILSLIVEGGAALLQSFIDEGLWDEARVFTGNITLQRGIKAPHINGNIGEEVLSGNDRLTIFYNDLI